MSIQGFPVQSIQFQDCHLEKWHPFVSLGAELQGSWLTFAPQECLWPFLFLFLKFDIILQIKISRAPSNEKDKGENCSPERL